MNALEFIDMLRDVLRETGPTGVQRGAITMFRTKDGVELSTEAAKELLEIMENEWA